MHQARDKETLRTTHARSQPGRLAISDASLSAAGEFLLSEQTWPRRGTGRSAVRATTATYRTRRQAAPNCKEAQAQTHRRLHATLKMKLVMTMSDGERLFDTCAASETGFSARVVAAHLAQEKVKKGFECLSKNEPLPPTPSRRAMEQARRRGGWVG